MKVVCGSRNSEKNLLKIIARLEKSFVELDICIERHEGYKGWECNPLVNEMIIRDLKNFKEDKEPYLMGGYRALERLREKKVKKNANNKRKISQESK